MEILNNLARRKLRNGLTISGIVIGIVALTTLGALAQQITSIVNGGLVYYGSSVQVQAAGDGRQSFITLEDAQKLRSIPGVTAINPTVSMPLAPGTSGRFIGPDDMILTWDPYIDQYSNFNLQLATGQFPSGAPGQVVLGSDVAVEYGKHVGDTIALPVKPRKAAPDFVQRTFTVVGITQRTHTLPDYIAWINLPDAQALAAAQLSPAIRSSVNMNDLVQGVSVYGPKGAGVATLDKIADAINSELPQFGAKRPSQAISDYQSATVILTAITTGAALISLLIGGLSVVNTMLMAVSERVREIGLKKAVGATTRHMLVEFLAESATIGLIGGLLGWSIGVAITAFVNHQMGANNQIFLVTPALTGFAIGFAIALGSLAGVLPAWRAARMDPVAALRST